MSFWTKDDHPVDLMEALQGRYAPLAALWGNDHIPEEIGRALWEYSFDLKEARGAMDAWIKETLRDDTEHRWSLTDEFGESVSVGYAAHQLKKGGRLPDGAIVELSGTLEGLFRAFPGHSDSRATLRITVAELREEMESDSFGGAGLLRRFPVTFIRKKRGETREEAGAREKAASAPGPGSGPGSEETDEEGGAE